MHVHNLNKKVGVSTVLVAVVVVVIVAVSGIGYYFFYMGSSAPKPSQVVVGAELPLSGNFAAVGKLALNGIQMTVDSINSKGGIDGVPIKVIPLDDGSNPATVLSNARSLDQQGAVALIGGVADLGDPLAQYANSSKIPVIITNDAIPKTVLGYPHGYVFTPTLPLNTVYENVSFAFMKSIGIKTLAIIRADLSYTLSTSANASEIAKLYGINVVSIANFPTSPTLPSDYSSWILPIKNLNPDAVWVLTSMPAFGNIVVQMNNLGLKPKLTFNYAGIADAGFVTFAGTKAENVAGTVLWVPFLNAASEAFNATYASQFHATATYYSQMTHDATYVLAQAIKGIFDSGQALTRDSLRNALSNLQIAPGADSAFGPMLSPQGIKFDRFGYNDLTTVYVGQIQGGKLVMVYPSSVAGTNRIVYPAP